MSARVEIPVVAVGWESVESTLAQLRNGADEFELFIIDQLDELCKLNQKLDARRQQIEQREQASQTEREEELQRAATAESAREEEGSAKQAELVAELEKTRTDLSAMQSELANVQASAEQEVKAASLVADELRATVSQRDELTEQITRLQSESPPHAGSADELLDLRADLEAARAELAERKRQSASVGTPSDEETARRMQELEQERFTLETELEHVRNRAAEASDALDEHKRRASEERAEWSGELKQMRRTLEKQSQLLVERQHEAPTVAETPKSVDDRHPPDPVLDSVMAQFETLQKDLIRRRKQKGRSGRSGVA